MGIFYYNKLKALQMQECYFASNAKEYTLYLLAVMPTLLNNQTFQVFEPPSPDESSYTYFQQ